MQVVYTIYVITIAIAFLSSLICFRLDYPFYLKLFSVLLGLTFLVEFFSAFISKSFHLKNNFWIYNSFTLIEFWCYAYFYSFIIKIKGSRKIIKGFLWLYPMFWATTVFFIFRFNVWNSYVIIVGSFFSVLFAIMYYHQLIFSDTMIFLRRQPEFWIATGMLVFYLGALPYFGMLNFLVKNYLSAANKLLYILLILNTLMYLLFSYGFLCRIINTKRS